ncbi:SMI1/KNR4 family protein [Bacillus pseudomycoides]|uniref:SMI1/KNR4 family protein n=1 Tax=Bacillus pseudomycoides TaxID=64104 RepID=UPI00211D75E5|nr:SMI1/KNR4 family protein [Bacillus pseudomycoides]
MSEEVVLEVSNKLGVSFPKDYIDCVKKNNGGNVEPKLFDVNRKERVFGTLLSFDIENDEFILSVYADYKKTLPNRVIPIAFDPAGNLICFDYKNHDSNPKVVFWEHEGATEKEELIDDEGMTEEAARENVFYVASTFTEFLNKLHD